jgi:hypothetical protein
MRYAVVLQYRDGHVIEFPCESYDEAFALAAHEVCGGRDPQLAQCSIEERPATPALGKLAPCPS